MDARFLNDLMSSNTLRMRAHLLTRRLYGTSERNLPLYEEDEQKQTEQLGFDEKLVLLPFGTSEPAGSAPKLKIEITPDLSNQSPVLASGAPRPLEIKILKSSPGNLINVSAMKTPHRFVLSAALFEDGREVAQGKSSDLFIEEAREITLQPNQFATGALLNNPIALNLNVTKYFRDRPTDEVAIFFDLAKLPSQSGGAREPLAKQWAGIHQLGSPFEYDLTGYYLKDTGKKYQLKLTISLAGGEDLN
jgi:hypothetical protein